MLKNTKRKWKKFLEALAEQNKKTYGEGGLDCCELKNVTQNKPQNHTKQK